MERPRILAFAVVVLCARSVFGQSVKSLDQLPLAFEENQGQTAKRADFVCRGPGYTLLLSPTEAVFKFERQPMLDLTLVGAKPATQAAALEPLPGRSNYLVGSDPSKWHTGIPQFAKVRYAGVYPGVDVVYYGNQRQLEYDFVVAPGADPGAIQFAVRGARSLRADSRGDLLVATDGGTVRLGKPVVYQERDGARHEVAGAYVIRRGHRVQFRIAAYDRTRPLVIDPTFSIGASKTLSGTGTDNNALAIAVDAVGSSYLTGFTNSVDFPTAGAAQARNRGGEEDAFVTKLSDDGSTIIYSTFLGGSAYDGGTAIAVDSYGSAYVLGTTSSADFPVTAGALQGRFGGGFQDAFLAKLSPAGDAFEYATYLGGSDLEFAAAVAVGSDGSAYVTGSTSSSNFPTVAGSYKTAFSGIQKAFVSKVNAAGSALVYSTLLGGSLADSGMGIAVDAGGNAYVTGQAQSSNFPTTPGAFQTTFRGNPAYVTKLNPAGSALVYSTLVGGSTRERPSAIVLDRAGDAYITGSTTSADFPTTTNAYQKIRKGPSDAFVTKLNAAGSALVFSTLLGGSGDDTALAIALSSGASPPPVWVAGSTTGQADFPTAAPLQACVPAPCPRGACNSGTVTQLAGDGSSLLFSTCTGATGHDVIVNGIGAYGDSLRLAAKDFTPAGAASAARLSLRNRSADSTPEQEKIYWIYILTHSDIGGCHYVWGTVILPLPARNSRTSTGVVTARGCDWTIVVPNTPDGWLSVSPVASDGTANISLSVNENRSKYKRCMNLLGTGNPDPVTIRVCQDGTQTGITAPGTPTSLTAAASGSSVTLAWRAPTTGESPTSYTIEAGSASGLSDLASVPTGNAETSYSVSAVATGRYYVRVRASNSAGTSTPSNEALLVVGGGCAAPPTPPTLAVTFNSGTLTFSWSGANGGVTSYSIEAGSRSGATDIANTDLQSTATTFTATSVARGTYFVRVRARNACGISSPSNEVTVTVP